MFRALTIAAITAAAAAGVSAAFAQSKVEVGVLECSGGATASYVVGSTTELNCTFRPSAGGSESYRATIRRVGLDVGFTDKTALAWAVFAPSRSVEKGALAGSYGGISAGATVGVGGGANVLVGGSDRSIALQPLSLQGQTGVSLAATVSSLQLQAAAPSKASKSSSKKKK